MKGREREKTRERDPHREVERDKERRRDRDKGREKEREPHKEKDERTKILENGNSKVQFSNPRASYTFATNNVIYF